MSSLEPQEQPSTTPTIAHVVLKPKRALPFYARHPWVFAGAVDRIVGAPSDGDEVDVVSTTGGFIARGLYNSQSKIVVRLYSWQPERALDEQFWLDKLTHAVNLRRDWLKLDHGASSAFRAIFSEADGLSGIIVDKFADFAIVQFTALGPARRQHLLGPMIQQTLGVRGVLRRTEKGIGKLEGLELHDGPLCGEEPPEEVIFTEHGLKFAVNLREGQKTGYYLDQRSNRLAVAGYCAGKRVLDAFSYSGGFGIYAKHAGAIEVESVDASQAALALAARNAELNQLPGIVRTQADVFGYLGELVKAQRQFDVVILDPPKFARNRAAVPAALQGYRRLHQQAIQLLPRGGLLVSCCCTGLITQEQLEAILAQTATEARRDLQLLERRGPSADHPTSLACPEGSYLKCLISRVG